MYLEAFFIILANWRKLIVVSFEVTLDLSAAAVQAFDSDSRTAFSSSSSEEAVFQRGYFLVWRSFSFPCSTCLKRGGRKTSSLFLLGELSSFDPESAAAAAAARIGAGFLVDALLLLNTGRDLAGSLNVSSVSAISLGSGESQQS